MDADVRAQDRAPELEFPRIASALAGLQTQPLVASPPIIREDGPLPHSMARALVVDAVRHQARPVYGLLAQDEPDDEHAPVEPDLPLPQVPGPSSCAVDDDLIDQLPLRDVAREALRARLMAFGEARSQRTVYEHVFLMLAFSVMVLLVAPPLVDVLLAAHGVRH